MSEQQFGWFVLGVLSASVTALAGAPLWLVALAGFVVTFLGLTAFDK